MESRNVCASCEYSAAKDDYLCVICRYREVLNLTQCENFEYCDKWTSAQGPQYCYTCRETEEEEEDFFPCRALVSEHQLALAPLE